MCPMILQGCFETQPVVAECVQYPPPMQFLVDTENPVLVEKPVWRDVAVYAVELRSALDQCNADKESLRDWYAEVKDDGTQND